MNVRSLAVPTAFLLVALTAGLTAGTASAVVDARPAGAQNCGNVQNVAPRITPDRTTLSATETTTVSVTGTNYLLPSHVCGTDVFGGVYLFFGWVKPGGQWGPSWRTSTSATGLFGQTYSYPGEGGGAETRDDGTGAVRLISFTPGGESGTATEFHMDASGNWSSSLVVRGSTYTFTDIVTGNTQSVDCLLVQCGVFTIGAHGKSSRTNEQFSPINFTTGAGQVVVPPPAAPDAAPGGAVAGGLTAGSGSGATATTVPKGSSGTGGAGTSGAAGTDDGAPGTTGPAGSVGEAPTETTVPAAVASETTERGDDTQQASGAAQVQDFGDDGGDSGGSAPLIGGVIGAAVLLGGAGAIVARRRRTGATPTGQPSTGQGAI